MVAFIGCITAKRESEQRSVSSDSIPQYPNAVRPMLLHTFGYAVDEFPLVSAAHRACARWKGENHPNREVRCRVPALMVHIVLGFSM